MKHCPTCQTEYDEDIIVFCTKDGTPLVDKEQPVFTDNMPSDSSDDSEDDEGAQTIIRRKPPAASGTEPLTPLPGSESGQKEDSQRIVISTAGEKKDQSVRPKAGVPRQVEPEKSSNTAIIVLLTIIATVLVFLGAFTVYWMLSGGGVEDNSNINLNENIDINGNLNSNDNFNIDDLNLNLNSNSDENFNINSNSNFNLSTPTPSKTPSPSPSPTESPSPSPTPSASPSPTTSPTATPTPAPTRIVTPTPPRPPTNNNTVNVGTINGRAVLLPTPAYPSAARNVRAGGRVAVNVTIDSNGNVVAAKAVLGHPLLRSSAEAAARRSKFKPVSVNGRTVAAKGTILYNFVN